MRPLLATATVVALMALSACGGGNPSTGASPKSNIGKPQRAPTNDEKQHRRDKHGREGDKSPRPRREPPKSRPTDSPPPTPKATVRYLVTDVVDGDTVKVAKSGGTTIRIIGIDTPETVDPFGPVECGGPEASAAAVRLLSGQRVQLVYDPSQGRFDVYDRTLAYLTVPGLGDFGLAMLRRGLAAEYTYDSVYAHQTQYIRAESRARAQRSGVWDECGGVDKPLETPHPKPSPPSQPRHLVDCASGYSPCVPPYPPDLDCDDINGPVSVTGGDPHGFDADGDGTGCDS